MIGMGAFIAFILTLGTLMILQNDHDSLVDQNYYQKGQNYNADMQEKQQAVDDAVLPGISVSGTGMRIDFRAPVTYRLDFRRPSDARMDRRLTGTTGKQTFIGIPGSSLAPGPWTLRIEYMLAGKKYLFEDEVVMP